MITIDDLFDPADLAAAIEGGYVRVQDHPTEWLRILNYTEQAVWERAWTPVTRQCRGLIVDSTGSGRIIARPWPKFFNYGEHEDGTLDLAAPVEVTDKADGCFPGNTALNLWGGGTITIGEVVRKRLRVTLVGIDERGDMVPAEVTDWHDNGTKDHWLDIEVDAPVSRRSGAGGHPNRLRVTVNHHIYVGGEYRPACDLRPGDLLTTQTWSPSDEVLRLIRASLLGDGCLVASATKPEHAKYQEPHADKHADYVQALRKVLGDCGAHRADTISGYGSTLTWAGSREYAALGEMRAEWYPGGGPKRVPDDLSWLDDFAVAKWVMDDGYRQTFARQADRLAFATHSFSRADIVRLGEHLAELYGVTYHLNDDVRGRGTTLVVNSGRKQQIRLLWAAIAPHVHPSMRYKLPAEYRDEPYLEPEVGREVTVSRTARVLSVTRVAPTRQNFPHGRVGFDVTTTTHNYLARGVLVHNSLGILYPTPDGHAIATRGSFTSEQALHATEIYRARYAGKWAPDPAVTYLFEIVYPSNRIVLDYGDLDDLILLGAVDIATGRPYGPHHEVALDWPGIRVDVHDYATLADALAAEPRKNAEGLVVRYLDGAHPAPMVKIKQEDYVSLHRIITGLTARRLWERAAVFAVLTARPDTPHRRIGQLLHLDAADVGGIVDAGPDWGDDVRKTAPEEFTAWIDTTLDNLRGQAVAIAIEAHTAADQVRHLTRKDAAAAIKDHPHRALIFSVLDGRDITGQAWASIRPAAERPFMDRGEDVA